MMNVRPTERESKCDAKQRSLVQRVLVTTKSLRTRLSNRDGVALNSILMYWALTYSIYPLTFGFDFMNSNVYWDNGLGAVYFLLCSLIPLLSIVYIFYSSAFISVKATTLQKAASIVLLLLVVENVFMAIDAIDNLETWTTLEMIDTFIHGDSDWIVPFGASDLVLAGIGVMCLMSSQSYQEYR